MKRARRVAVPCVAGLVSLAAISPAQNSEFTLPPYVGAYQPQGVDERGLWMMQDESERLLRDSPIVITDPALNSYVRSVLCRTVGTDRCGGVRLYIMRVPRFNATMSPNGTMQIWSGLLLRVRNEAELGSVLGHEFAHFELRHSLEDYRRRRAASDFLAWTALIGAAAQRYGGGYSSYGDYRISVFGALAHYNRDQERLADVRGFAYIGQAGYRPSAAADVWRSVMNEADATAAGRARRSTRYDNVAFFASHPTDLQRADYLSGLANRIPTQGDYDGRDAYRAAMAPWIPQFLDDQIKLNDFGGTEQLLARLSSDGWTAPLLYARGELYRARGNPRDLVQAAEFYQLALKDDPTMTAAFRGLGLSLLRSGSVEPGRAALRSYLSTNPQATDAAMLQSLIGQP